MKCNSKIEDVLLASKFAPSMIEFQALTKTSLSQFDPLALFVMFATDHLGKSKHLMRSSI